MDLEFTGERYVPGTEGIEDLYAEHISRYLAAGRLVEGAAVLDVGCGCGYGTSHLASCGALHVLGADLSPEAIGFARSHYQAPNLDFAVMDARALALGTAFQVVTCFEVIEHVEDAPRVLTEISRVLAERGVLLVSTPNKATYVAGGVSGTNPFHVREYTAAEFEELLRPVFPRVSLLDQRWCEGLIVESHRRLPAEGGSRLEEVALPGELTGPAASAAAEAAYFIAVCGKTIDSEKMLDRLPPLLVNAGSARYRTLKRQTKKLQAEFDRRAAWAARLRADVEARDATIRKLQAELAALEAVEGTV